MKRIAIPSVLFILFGSLVWAINLLSCRDQYPEPPGIEGRWRQLTGITGERYHTLQDNLLTQETYVGNTLVASLQFTYAQRGDTLIIGSDGANSPRTWITRLVGDQVMEVRERAGMFELYYLLERLP